MDQRDPETYAIIGAAMEVHTVLGHGFLESVYHDALCHELELREIPFQREVPFPIIYKGVRMESMYRADLVCFGSIVVEIKALQRISGGEESQLLNYLKASGMQRGVLLNFGSPKLLYERMVWNYEE
ncbi:MAG: GxxExxY protein [Flavobacteriales bacterium]|nr:GxxExxY protein [Flavobacteriales bacterium]